jgi:hypothetical protein
LWRSLDPAASVRRMGQGPIASLDEDPPEAHVAFWRGELARFLYAKTEEEAISALAGALRSEVPMPDGFRRVLAGMLENGGVVDGEMSWTIKVVRRRDTKHIRGMLSVYAACKEVERLVSEGMLPTVACRVVAGQCGKSQRSIEIAYQTHRKRLDMAIGEPKRRAEAAMRRSKALPENLRSGSQLEDDPGS